MAETPSEVPDLRTYLNRRMSALDQERKSFDAHWKELAEYVLPRRGRFFVTDRNKGDKRHNKIINSKATQALRTAASGLMANLTSPARPWLKLETPDPDMMEFAPVKLWLEKVETGMRLIFNKSNLYNALPMLYTELLLFSTGCMSHVDDFDDVARFYTHTVGSYWIAQNERCRVDTLYRQFEWPVSMIVGEFGLNNCSQAVRDRYNRGDYDSWYPVWHAIEPNPEYDPSRPLARHKRYRSIYWEPGMSDAAEKNLYLRRSGFDEFPAYCPRWDLTGEDIYGTNGPGMAALGDVKQLQHYEKKKARAIDKISDPALRGPASLKNIPVSQLPGGLTTYDEGSQGKLEPIHVPDPRIQEMLLDIQHIEQRIDQAFYADLFMAITNMEGIQPRNQLELMQRNEEKLLMLGPVIERLFNELLDPLVDRTFNQMARAGLLPPAPEELQGQALKVEYISSLAMAQRAVGTGSIERTIGFAGAVAQIDPTAAAKVDGSQAIDEYASRVGAPPKMIRSDEVAAAIVSGQQQQAQMPAMMEMAAKGAQAAAQGAQAAKTLSEVPGMQDQIRRARR